MIGLLWLIPAIPFASAALLLLFGDASRAERPWRREWDRSDFRRSPRFWWRRAS